MHESFGLVLGCYVLRPTDYLLRLISEIIIIVGCAGVSTYFLRFTKNANQAIISSNLPSPSGTSDVILLAREGTSSRNSNESQNESNKLVMPKIKVTTSFTSYEQVTKFFIKIMKITYFLIILFMTITLPLFILFNWYPKELKTWLKEYFDLEIIFYEIIHHSILLCYAIHKPTMYLLFYRKQLKIFQFLNLCITILIDKKNRFFGKEHSTAQPVVVITMESVTMNQETN